MYCMHVVSPLECVGPIYMWDPYTMIEMLRVSNTYGTTSFPNEVVLCVNQCGVHPHVRGCFMQHVIQNNKSFQTDI